MPSTTELYAAAKAVVAAIDPVVADLGQRPDYQKSYQTAAKTFLDFKQGLLDLLALPVPPPDPVARTRDAAKQTVLPLAGRIVDANLALLKMGQLNTQRILPPETAKAHNVHLMDLQTAAQNYVAVATAYLQAGPGPDIPPDNPFDPPRDERVALFTEWMDSIGGS